jgi:hypothetical protein
MGAGAKRSLFAAALVAAGAGVWLAAVPSPAAKSKLIVVVSGDTNGWIIPCGCASNQSGGLPRRGSYLREQAAEGTLLYADAGGASSGDSEYQRIKFEAILKGERAMGVVAHNIGASEAKLGSAALKEIAAKAGVTLVSSNLTTADGSPVAESYVVVERGGWRVAFLGVLSPSLAPQEYTVQEPRAAVSSIAADLRSQCDAIVVLAYLPSDELRQFALDVPEVDLVVGGPTGQAIPPQNVGPVLLTSATNKGKFLARLEREPGEKAAWNGTTVEMAASLSDEPVQKSNLEGLQALLTKLDMTPEQAGLAAVGVGGFPSGYQIAGSEACRKCHSDDCKQWDSSKHAIAWHTLVEKKFSGDPSCRQCHTTGYGMPGGFRTAATTPDRTKVGCESCHGPSQAHCDSPTVKTPFAARDRCTTCHDHENSPTFQLDAYWAKIIHGKKVEGAKR